MFMRTEFGTTMDQVNFACNNYNINAQSIAESPPPAIATFFSGIFHQIIYEIIQSVVVEMFRALSEFNFLGWNEPFPKAKMTALNNVTPLFRSDLDNFVFTSKRENFFF